MRLTGIPSIDNSDAKFVLGSDECGLGSWAGPLTVCGVLAPRTWHGEGAADSKALSRKKRRQLYEQWTTTLPLTYHVVSIPSDEIDHMGVQNALLLAHRTVIETLLKKAVLAETLVIVDGLVHQSLKMPGVTGFPQADSIVAAVGAASILGKVTHDLEMERLSKLYPEYAFESNMGYGSKAHQEALKQYGPCPIHRRSYAPIAKLRCTDPNLWRYHSSSGLEASDSSSP